MATTQVALRNRDLYAARAGLAVIAGAKRGKVDLYGTFKFHLSVLRAAVEKNIEALDTARRELRDEHGRRDGKNQLVTQQLNPDDPNGVQVVLKNPMEFEADERHMFETPITVNAHVPLLKLDDVLALDFGEQPGDYSGALMFIEVPAASEPDIAPEPAAKKTRRQA